VELVIENDQTATAGTLAAMQVLRPRHRGARPGMTLTWATGTGRANARCRPPDAGTLCAMCRKGAAPARQVGGCRWPTGGALRAVLRALPADAACRERQLETTWWPSRLSSNFYPRCTGGCDRPALTLHCLARPCCCWWPTRRPLENATGHSARRGRTMWPVASRLGLVGWASRLGTDSWAARCWPPCGAKASLLARGV
jgi:hypothetical protein